MPSLQQLTGQLLLMAQKLRPAAMAALCCTAPIGDTTEQSSAHNNDSSSIVCGALALKLQAVKNLIHAIRSKSPAPAVYSRYDRAARHVCFHNETTVILRSTNKKTHAHTHTRKHTHRSCAWKHNTPRPTQSDTRERMIESPLHATSSV